jgi:hypothetical protein
MTDDYYVGIKARAVELLTSPDGFNGYTADQIRSWNGGYLRNVIGIAIIHARNEAQRRVVDSVDRTKGMTMVPIRFIKLNHHKIGADILRDFRSGVRS